MEFSEAKGRLMTVSKGKSASWTFELLTQKRWRKFFIAVPVRTAIESFLIRRRRRRAP